MSRRPAGFTLIELMVTVTVMAVLALVGMPFASKWVESNRQMQARNLMWEGVSQVRSLALRNPSGALAGHAAAQLVRDGRSLSVLASPEGPALWSGQLPRDAVVKLVGADDFADGQALQDAGGELTCVAFGNRGQRLPSASDCVSLTSARRLAIGLKDQDPLYVDLL